jgi:HAD superfamily hydrolase (TIGR01509 family)
MNWIRNFHLFLFDFDGLLVDTEALHYQAYINTLAKRGYLLNWSYSRYSEMAHLNATAIREGLYADFPDLDPNWAQIYEEKKQIYLQLLASGAVKLMPGVELLLRALENENIRRCVVTHSPFEQTRAIRSRLPVLDTIPHWITRENYEKSKPDPECYFKAIELHGHLGDRIIGFEDSARGLKALAATPALPVLVCPSHHPLLEMALEGGGGAIHVESFEQIGEILPAVQKCKFRPA